MNEDDIQDIGWVLWAGTIGLGQSNLCSDRGRPRRPMPALLGRYTGLPLARAPAGGHRVGSSRRWARPRGRPYSGLVWKRGASRALRRTEP